MVPTRGGGYERSCFYRNMFVLCTITGSLLLRVVVVVVIVVVAVVVVCVRVRARVRASVRA